MKSVGEAMSIGRNFTEAFGKVLRSLETKAAGFWTQPDPEGRPGVLSGGAERRHDGRLYTVERALGSARPSSSLPGVRIDPWFLDQIV